MTQEHGTPLLAGAYLDFLFGRDEGWACLRTYEGGKFGHPNGPTHRHWFQWPQQRNDMLGIILGNTDFDLYVIPVLFKDNSSNRASNIKHQTCTYADADTAAPHLFRVVPTITLETSPGRYHLIWKTGTDSSADLCKVGRIIAHTHAEQGCDKSGWDPGQLLRIPGTTNNKPRDSGPCVVRATTTGQIYSLEDLREAYPAPPEPDPATDAGPLPSMPPPHQWMPLHEAERVLKLNPDLLDLYTLAPDAKVGDKRYREGVHFNASVRMWRLLCELARRGVDRHTALVLGWHAGCCKYRMDGRPVTEMWVEVCKAFAQPENQAPQTELEIEQYLARREAEQAQLDGESDQSSRYLFLSEQERLRVPNDTVVDRYVEWARGTTDAAPQYHRAGILTVLSAVFGEFALPPTQFYMGRLNLWFLVLGGTTRSRKSTARHMWLKLLHELENENYSYDIGSDATPEALYEELEDKDGRSSVFHRDEVHGLLSEESSKGYLSGLRESMTELYDGFVRMRKRVGSSGSRKKKKTGSQVTTNFVLNFSGVTDDVTEALTTSDFGSGYLARFLYAYAEPPPRDREKERMQQWGGSSIQRNNLPYLEIREELKGARTHWARKMSVYRQKHNDIPRIPFEASAWERMNDFAWDLGTAASSLDMSKMVEPVADRMAKSVLKTACLLAMAEQSAAVRMRHLLKAIELGEEWFHHMLIVASKIRESSWKREQDDVIAAVDASSGRITWSSLYRKFRGRMKPKQFEEIIMALTQSGEVVVSHDRGNRVVARMVKHAAEPAPVSATTRDYGASYPATQEDSSGQGTEQEAEQAHEPQGNPGSFLGIADIPA